MRQDIGESLRVMCYDTAEYLRGAWGCTVGGPREELESIITGELVAQVIGMFEQNNVGVRRPTALTAWLKQNALTETDTVTPEWAALLPQLADFVSYDDDDDEQEEDAEEEAPVNGAAAADGSASAPTSAAFVSCLPCTPVTQYSLTQFRQDWSDADQESDPFVPLDGTALYSRTCTINHSCDPNVEVVYSPAPVPSHWPNLLPLTHAQFPTPLTVEVRALRELKKDEEIFFSYIDTSLSLEERTNSLKDYGFTCTCSKCQNER